MKWFEYKQEVDALHAPDSLKERLRAMQAGNGASAQSGAPAPKSAAAAAFFASDRAEPAAAGRRPEPQAANSAAPRAPAGRPPRRFPRWQQLAALAASFAFGIVACDAFGWQVLPRMGSTYTASADGAAEKGALYSTNGALADTASDTATAETSTADTSVQNNAAAEASLSDATGQSDAGAGCCQVALPQSTSRKIIYTANLSLESKTYDDALAALRSAVLAAGGYVESSDESNYGESARSTSLTCRIPADAYEDFLDAAAQTGSLVSKSQSANDITAAYVDVAARIDALETQRTRLQELEQKADNLSDLLQIESSLSDVQYQLESYESQKKVYDDQVDFCTVNINLQEVETFTPTETTFWARFVRALSDALVHFGAALANVAFWLAERWPWLVVLAAVCAAVLFVKKRKGRKA